MADASATKVTTGSPSSAVTIRNTNIVAIGRGLPTTRPHILR
jgi:hypothetical protein